MSEPVPALVKSWDTAQLVARLKGKGLDVAEELVKVLAGEVLDWSQESLLLDPNPYVKMLAPLVSAVKPVVMGEVDKIDGQVG